MPNKIILLCLFGLFFFSCEKVEEHTFLKIGQTQGMNYFVESDTIFLYKPLNFDFNRNGTIDFIFENYIVTNEYVYYHRVKSLDSKNQNITLATYIDVNQKREYLKVFKKGDLLLLSQMWSSGRYFIDFYNPSFEEKIPHSPYFSESYVALRLVVGNTVKYGWIKVWIDNDSTFIILESAIQK